MIKELLYTLEDLMFCTAVDKDAIRVPTFYASSNKSHEDLWMIWTIIVALLFGGIHCAGWNFPFPSHAELIIWRVSSLIIVVVPCALVPPYVAAALGMDTIGIITVLVLFFGVVIYVLARLTLFVEAFIALRHLPPGAYAVVEWSALLLHM